MSQERITPQGTLPYKKPNKHRLDAGQPPFVLGRNTRWDGTQEKLPKEERSRMLALYNKEIQKLRDKG